MKQNHKAKTASSNKTAPVYRLYQLIQMSACVNCHFCAEVCPAVTATKNGELSAPYRISELTKILKSRTGLLGRLLGKKTVNDEQLMHYSDTVFRCTLCGNCQEVCPVGIHLKDLWLSVREDMVNQGGYPKNINRIKSNMLENRNVFNEDNAERADWVDDLQDPPEDSHIKESAEVVYFTGCVAAYFPLAQQIPLALVNILEAAGVDFTLLGEDEWCCGFPMLGAGLKTLSTEFIEHNIAAVKAKGAKTVVFACPSCFQMWMEYYPYKEHGIDIAHGTQYLASLIRENRIPMKALDLTVTYHDPCDLGRGARVFDAPREVIQAIPGVKLVELPENRESCKCCGGGGNLEMIDPDLSAKIALRKIDEVMSTGADAVISSCQQCVRTMTTAARRNKIRIQVMDVIQLVHKALNE